ncbi:hypothetical protein LCGC14_1950250 [marine sediment metagenome]|uniref:Uncharacterized protein n=1 Tax=marine sediment metagenome TaxID=412755 RepID=A0A0F9FI09_9ZZZZ
MMQEPHQMEDELLQFDPTEAEGFALLPQGWFVWLTGEVRTKNADGEPLTREVEGKTVRRMMVQCLAQAPVWAKEAKRQTWEFMDLGGPWAGFTENFLVALGFPTVSEKGKKVLDPTVLPQLRLSDISNKEFAARITHNVDKNDPEVTHANLVKPVPVARYNESQAAVEPTVEFPGEAS